MVMLLVAAESKVLPQTWLLGTILTNQGLCDFLQSRNPPLTNDSFRASYTVITNLKKHQNLPDNFRL